MLSHMEEFLFSSKSKVYLTVKGSVFAGMQCLWGRQGEMSRRNTGFGGNETFLHDAIMADT